MRILANRTELLAGLLFAATCLSVWLDIPIVRPILSFLLLTFVPGILCLRILRLHWLEPTERLVLAVGMSIACVTLLGLVANSVFPSTGIRAPLAAGVLLPWIGFGVVLLGLASAWRQKSVHLRLAEWQGSRREVGLLAFAAMFPLLSVVGTAVLNRTGSNFVLVTVLVLIPLYVLYVAFDHRRFPARLYPPTILLISLSVALLMGLRSDHLIGADIHTEYYLFRQTLANGHWSDVLGSILDPCLSITILPTIYQVFLGTDPEYLFKTLYPILFSVVPLVVYAMSKPRFGSRVAFLGAAFFMSQLFFQRVAQSPRTSVGILFFSLAVMVLLRSGLNAFTRNMLFMVFGLFVVFGHYSTAYIFVAVLLIVLGLRMIARQVATSHRGGFDSRDSPVGKDLSRSVDKPAMLLSYRRCESRLTSGKLVWLFSVMFLWYGQLTSGVFQSGVGFVTTTLRNLQEFFVLESRGVIVEAAFRGAREGGSIPERLDVAFAWLAVACIAIGVLVLLSTAGSSTLLASWREKRLTLRIPKPDDDYVWLVLGCCTVLLIQFALPFVAVGYDVVRSMGQMAVVLSPCFVLGGMAVGRKVCPITPSLVVLAVLVPYFLCTSGVMYQVFGVPHSIVLNSYGQQYEVLFVHDEETSAAIWVASRVPDYADKYSDSFGGSRLVSQGGIIGVKYAAGLIEEHEPIDDGFFYLRWTGVVEHKLLDGDYAWHELHAYEREFASMGCVYASIGSELHLSSEAL